METWLPGWNYRASWLIERQAFSDPDYDFRIVPLSRCLTQPFDGATARRLINLKTHHSDINLSRGGRARTHSVQDRWQ